MQQQQSMQSSRRSTTSKINPQEFLTRKDIIKQITFPESTNNQIIVKMNETGYGFNFSIFDPRLELMIDKNSF